MDSSCFPIGMFDSEACAINLADLNAPIAPLCRAVSKVCRKCQTSYLPVEMRTRTRRRGPRRRPCAASPC